MFREGTLPVPAVRVNQRTVLMNPGSGDAPVGGVGLYARVSSRDQRADVERQVARRSEWAAQANAPVVRVGAEVGSSDERRQTTCMGVARHAIGRSRRSVARSVVSARRCLSVPGVTMWCMGERRVLRRIGDPVVATGPAGVRVRTRLHLTETEAAAVAAVGSFLGSVYRAELAGRVEMGRLDHAAHAAWRAQRKQAVTALSSSRWAGAITRAVEDQYQLGIRGLAAHVSDLRQAVEVLAQRCALRPGEHDPGSATPGRGRRGYRSANERFAKTRRLAVLRSRLGAAEDALAGGRPSITVGGKRLWRNRNHLDEAGKTETQWRARWDGARMFLTADGESGKAGGNETIRVDEVGRLRIKVPAALTGQYGTHLSIGAPIAFSHRGTEWATRVAGRRAVRDDIAHDPAKDRWYLDASWKQDTVLVAPSIEELRTGPVLGVDLNADHLAAWVLDESGNPVGQPITIPVDTAGLPATRRDGRVRAAITTLLDT
ncbi:MAG: hypothetical protein ACREJT_00815, partial [Myxococcota bacterium]